jgi:hypothetical protein
MNSLHLAGILLPTSLLVKGQTLELPEFALHLKQQRMRFLRPDLLLEGCIVFHKLCVGEFLGFNLSRQGAPYPTDLQFDFLDVFRPTGVPDVHGSHCVIVVGVPQHPEGRPYVHKLLGVGAHLCGWMGTLYRAAMGWVVLKVAFRCRVAILLSSISTCLAERMISADMLYNAYN